MRHCSGRVDAAGAQHKLRLLSGRRTRYLCDWLEGAKLSFPDAAPGKLRAHIRGWGGVQDALPRTLWASAYSRKPGARTEL